jgi:hypothetical protein
MGTWTERGARKPHEQALAGLRRVLADDHPTLRLMTNLGEVRRQIEEL